MTNLRLDLHEPTSIEILRRAFQLRGAWSGRQSHVGPVDALILAICLQANAVELVLTNEPAIVADLSVALGEVPDFAKIRVGCSHRPDDTRRLILLDVGNQDVPEILEDEEFLLCGFERGFDSSCLDHPAIGVSRRVLPLAFVAPALWRSRLAWCGRCDLHEPPMLERIRGLVGGDVLDPLRLFEDVQQLRCGGTFDKATDEIDTMRQKIRTLEARVEELERSGLVRHHIAAALAAARERASR